MNPFRQFWEARPTERARLVKPALYAAALLPLVNMAQGWSRGSFATSPVVVEEVILRSGNWAIRFLLASLAVTPLRGITGWNWLATYRRPLGLLAFTYATLHLLVYFGINLGLSLEFLILEVVGASYIIVGVTAFAAMAPLAVTSTTGWIRRLGKNWTLLHRLAYLALIAGVVHYALQLKQVAFQFLVYAVIGVLLLGYRGVSALTSSSGKRR